MDWKLPHTISLCPRMGAKKTAVEVHKFGGASLADGAAFRHAVAIVQARPRRAPVVVVSAPAGITDVLLGLATRAVAGDKSGRDGIDRRRRGAAHALPDDRERRAGRRQGGQDPARTGAAASPPRSTARSTSSRAAASLVALKELTPRTRDFVISRGERLSAQMFAAALAAAGTPSAYVDATEIVFTDGPFGGASPNLRAHRPGGAQEAAAADRRGQGAGRPRLHRQRATSRTSAARPTERARGRDAGPRRLRPDGDAARAGAGRARRCRCGRTSPAC